MNVEHHLVQYSKDSRIDSEMISAFYMFASAEEILRMTNHEAYAEFMANRQANFEVREREVWLTLPWWKRGYIIFGKWLRTKTNGMRQVLIGWLEWDDIGREDT